MASAAPAATRAEARTRAVPVQVLFAFRIVLTSGYAGTIGKMWSAPRSGSVLGARFGVRSPSVCGRSLPPRRERGGPRGVGGWISYCWDESTCRNYGCGECSAVVRVQWRLVRLRLPLLARAGVRTSVRLVPSSHLRTPPCVRRRSCLPRARDRKVSPHEARTGFRPPVPDEKSGRTRVEFAYRTSTRPAVVRRPLTDARTATQQSPRRSAAERQL